MKDNNNGFQRKKEQVNEAPARPEGPYVIPDEACCSAEFPQGCIFGEED